MNFLEYHLDFLGQDLDCDNSTAKIISLMMGYGKEKMPDGVQLVVSLIHPAFRLTLAAETFDLLDFAHRQGPRSWAQLIQQMTDRINIMTEGEDEDV